MSLVLSRQAESSGPRRTAEAAGAVRGGADRTSGDRVRQSQNNGQHEAGREARRTG